MSIWAEIKHSINSDLSKPLNELINGTKGLAASNNLYATLYSSSKIIYSPEITFNVPVKATFHWGGSFNLKCDLYTNVNLEHSSAYVPSLIIYKNSTEYKTLSGTYQDKDHSRSIECLCSPGDIFTFVFKRSDKSNVSATLSDLGIYADLIDVSGVTIESI